MINLNDTNKNQATTQQPDTDAQGRTRNSQNPVPGKNSGEEDISAVDRQEGNLEHGETGGYRENEQKQH